MKITSICPIEACDKNVIESVNESTTWVVYVDQVPAYEMVLKNGAWYAKKFNADYPFREVDQNRPLYEHCMRICDTTKR